MIMASFANDTISLKVLRLRPPTLEGPNPVIACEPRDMPQRSFQRMLELEGSAVDGKSENIAAGQLLSLPSKSDNCYLGETFVCYASVANRSQLPLDSIKLRAHVRVNGNLIAVPPHEQKSRPDALAPNETLEELVRYEIRALTTHTFIFEVGFRNPAGYSDSISKSFHVDVLRPLDVKTNFYNADQGAMYLETMIQNVTDKTFCLEKVEMEPAEQYTLTPLNTLTNGESVFSSKHMLQPHNSCQFLYHIKPKPAIASNPAALRAANLVGKVDIVWRSNMGDRGRLQTTALQRLPQAHKSVGLEVIEAKNIVKIGEPFRFLCRATNMLSSTAQLSAKLVAVLEPGCSFTGSTELDLGKFEPDESKVFPLTVCPTKLGLVKIAPLRFTERLTGAQCTIDKVVEVYVVDSDYHEGEPFQMSKFVRYDDGPVHNAREEYVQRMQIV